MKLSETISLQAAVGEAVIDAAERHGANFNGRLNVDTYHEWAKQAASLEARCEQAERERDEAQAKLAQYMADVERVLDTYQIEQLNEIAACRAKGVEWK